MGVTVEITALEHFPLLEARTPLFPALEKALDRTGFALRDRDVLIIAQKVVSKSENRYIELSLVVPSEEALRLSHECNKDPRLVEVILRESQAVVRTKPGVIIVHHRLGIVLANAGVDKSNVSGGASGERVLLLPEDPDARCIDDPQAGSCEVWARGCRHYLRQRGQALAPWHLRNMYRMCWNSPARRSARPRRPLWSATRGDRSGPWR